MKHLSSFLAAFAISVLAIMTTQAQPQNKKNDMSRICMTEWAGYYDSPETDFQKRFKLYKELGVDTIRVQTGWLDRPALVNVLKTTSFNIKLILYVLGIPKEYSDKYPNERMVDENGVADWHLGPWNAEFAETTMRTGRAEMEKLVKVGLAGHVKELVVDLGPAGEGIYPANWTVNDRKGEEAYWCYSVKAQSSFRTAMKGKYSDIDSANNAWALKDGQRFKSWDEVLIPKPRTAWACGPFWNDMLTWYRDSKRKMILARIEQTQSLAREFLGKDAKCIVYLPGYAYSQADWDQAVKEASGPASIRLMMDNDWLMTTAVAKGCTLQYTGVENVDEVRNMVRKLKTAGSSAYATMWGENAGFEGIGRNPGWLAEVITSYGLRGVDYTWSNWMFEKDGVTPSETYKRFAHSVRMIRDFYATGKRLPLALPEEAARQTSPGNWSLACDSATRLMGSYPDAIKGGDPEIAVVEGGQSQRILLRFPLESLPKGSSIRNARLIMKRYKNYREDQHTVKLGVYRVMQPWLAIGATWAETAAGTPWRRPGGTAEDMQGRAYIYGDKTTPWAAADVPVFKAEGDSVEWDVTALIKKLMAGPDYGMMITVTGQEQCNKSFASCAHLDPNMRPVLKVETEMPFHIHP